MSLVVAISTPEGPLMMCDSLAGSFATGNKFQIKDSKIIQIADDVLLGYTGDFLLGNAINDQLWIENWDKEVYPDERRYMLTQIMPTIKTCLEDYGVIDQIREKEKGMMIIAFGEYIFVIEHDLRFYQIAYPYHAIGSGHAVARGALFAQLDTIQTAPDVAAGTAMQAAFNHSMGVMPPFRRYDLRKF